MTSASPGFLGDAAGPSPGAYLLNPASVFLTADDPDEAKGHRPSAMDRIDDKVLQIDFVAAAFYVWFLCQLGKTLSSNS